MATTLAQLMERLSGAVPVKNGVPGAEQRQDALFIAVDTLNRKAPRTKIASLSITAGQASYSLPDDFILLISLDSLLSPDGVFISDGGLIPIPTGGWSERYTISNNMITFYPTPGYSSTRSLTYAAGHILNVDDEYPEMSRAEAGAVLLHAQAACLTLQANAAAQKAWTYQLGDERVSMERLAAELREQARELERQFVQTAERLSGASAYLVVG